MYSIAETILICILHQIYPRMKNFLSFCCQKKIGPGGGVLRERGLGTYTSPTLGFNKSHLLYSTRKKDTKDQF